MNPDIKQVINRFYLLIYLFSSSCTYTPNQNKKIVQSHNIKQQDNFFDKNYTPTGNYYQIIQASDSTVQIAWGTSTVHRLDRSQISLDFAERIRVQWENNYYLILRYGTGSGAWTSIICPLNATQAPLTYDNTICFDNVNSLLGTEESGDTILTVHNLKTHQSQAIIESQIPCTSVSPRNCIDTISIINRNLFYTWAVPDSYDTKKKVFDRRIKIKI